jgi:hypothetical protein
MKYQESAASAYMIQKDKKLLKEQDILSSHVPKPRKTSPPAVADAVKV